ncbi:hypothetical protein BDY24DRAFT_443082 [Mrakia frigida]|uniref:uncharacterized protein n=1 Tax=Mrakia frigida TaxID=29902 RepID=UPI003FCC15FC
MDPPLSPPPPLSQNLSSLLSQLQGSSASSTPPPPPLAPSAHSPSNSTGGRTIDDLFRTIRAGPPGPAGLPTSPTHSTSAMSQEEEQRKRIGLLSIFNTTSPASPPPPQAPPSSNNNMYPGSAPSSYIAAQNGPPLGANGSGMGGAGGKSLLDLLMGGGGGAGLQSPPTSSPYSQAPPPSHLRSEPSPPPQESMNPLVPSSPPPPPPPPSSSVLQAHDQQQETSGHSGSTPDYRPSEQPVPLASMASPSPPSSHPELVAVVEVVQAQLFSPSSPAKAPPPPSLFSFVSDFDAFGPPSSKRSKSVVPPGSGGATTLPLTRSISSTAGPAPPPRRSEEPLFDGLPPTSSSSSGQLLSFLSTSSTDTTTTTVVPGLPKLFPDLFPASHSLPLASPPASSHSPYSQDEQRSRTPLSSSMSNLASLAEGPAPAGGSSLVVVGDQVPSSSSSPKKQQPQFGHTRTPSGTLRASRGEVTPSGTYRAKGFVEVERKHRRSGSWQSVRAPKVLEGRETIIDVSLPNLESLVQSDVIQRKPITIIKGDLCFSKGRTVGSSRTGAIAYCMNKGRVRLIDETTGARALLKLPSEWFARDAQVANLELEGTKIACITTDGGLIVWSFPSTWSEDNPDCQIIYAVAPPSIPTSRFNLVKWQSPTTLGVSSGSSIVLLDLPTVSQAWLETSPSSPATPDFLFDGENTRRISFSPDPVVGFGFVNSSKDGSGRGFGVVVLSSSSNGEGEREKAMLATLMVTDEGESTYSVVEELDCRASSVMFVDERNVVVGSEKDTVAQLFKLEQEEKEQHGFSLRGAIRFEKPEGGPGMFAKIEWDPKRELLWISNTARSSLFAFRLQLHPSSPTSLPFTQVAEFPVDQAMSSFHISIFSNDFEIYTVSTHGIDQITIGDASLRDVFASSSSTATATEGEEVEDLEQELAVIIKTEEVEVSLEATSAVEQEESKPSTSFVANGGTSSNATPTVGRSKRRAKAAAAAAAATIPPPEDSFGRSQVASSSSSSGAVPGGEGAGGGAGVSSGLLAEIKKVEENIKNKVSALLEKQSNRLEANDLQRQETVFKLIANELKTNTTKVLASSVQSEMRANILPALLEVTREEIQALVQAEISKGLKDAMLSSLPSELERHLNSRGFASAVFPSIDKAIKDLIHKTLVPAYNDATSEMYDALSREIRADMVAIRKEVVAEQSNALIETHSLVQDMSKTILALGTQVLDLQKMVTKLQTQMERQPIASSSSSATRIISSPPAAPPLPSLNGPSSHHHQSPNVSSHTVVPPGSSAYPVHHRNPSLPPNLVQQPQPPFPMAPPPPPQQQQQQPPPMDLEDIWTETFMSNDPNALPAMISRISPQALDQMLPPDNSQAASPLSQTLILTLVHKFTDLLSKTNLQSSLFPTALLFIQRASRFLDPRDPVVAPYSSRVLSVVLSTLSKIEESVVRSAGTGEIGERERENVVRMLRGVMNELASKC